MNLYKIMQAQSNSVKLTWFTARGGREGCVWFASAKKCSAEGENLDYLISNTVTQVLKKNVKAKATNDYILEDDQEKFNFKILNIRRYFDTEWWLWISKWRKTAKLCVK